MRREDYNALYDLVGEFRQEEGELDSLIDGNLRRVREAEAYLRAFTDSETDDFRVFSPRRAVSVRRGELDKIRNEKEAWEKENQELYAKRDVLRDRTDRLEEILSRQKRDSISQKRAAREQKKAVVEELDRLIHKIEQGSADIDKNPIQVKQDFMITARQLREFADKIGNAAVQE